jgi:CRP-like cAMP-binding protein
MTKPFEGSPRNRILLALAPDTLEHIRPMLQLVQLDQRDLLHGYDTPVDHVYFPETCVGSVVGVMADGSAVETATIGDEGLVGIVLFFGSDRMAAQAFCQVPGDALRMSADDFRAVMRTPDVQRVLGRYTQALLTQIAQSAACNRTHAMMQRCARWILQTHDRVHVDEFPLRLDFLAQMVGVPRPAAKDSAASLQNAGAISYGQDRIRITNRSELERLACECYWIIAREHARLIEGMDPASPLREVRMSEDGKSTLQPPTDTLRSALNR